jgi:hypothetical protein
VASRSAAVHFNPKHLIAGIHNGQDVDRETVQQSIVDVIQTEELVWFCWLHTLVLPAQGAASSCEPE